MGRIQCPQMVWCRYLITRDGRSVRTTRALPFPFTFTGKCSLETMPCITRVLLSSFSSEWSGNYIRTPYTIQFFSSSALLDAE